MSGTEHVQVGDGAAASAQEVLSLKRQLDSLKDQLDAANVNAETDKLRLEHLSVLNNGLKETLRAELTRYDAVKQQLEAEASRRTNSEGELDRVVEELRTLKARKLSPDRLFLIGIILAALLAVNSIILSWFVLTKTAIEWPQVCGLLGAYLMYVTFAAILMRLLSDRCK